MTREVTFRDIDKALAGIAAINADYEEHRQATRTCLQTAILSKTTKLCLDQKCVARKIISFREKNI